MDEQGFAAAEPVSLIKFMIALCFVLGLIFLATYLFKKFSGIKGPRFRSHQVPIQIVGNVSLGDKKYLSIVEIQDKHYFIGISQTSINMLSELDLDITQTNEPSSDGDDRFENLFKKARQMLTRVKK